MTTTTTPILIIGGGPVGVCLALFLSYWSVPCTIFNTYPTTRTQPKGNGQNARTMEHYRQLGLSDSIRQLGLPDDHPFDQAFFTRLCAHEIYRFECASWAAREARRRAGPLTDQFVEPMYHVNQMYVERFLFEKLKECENVDVRFGWEVLSFSQTAHGVSIQARSSVDDKHTATWTAQYLIDCSGGRSAIRPQLGIEYVGDVQSAEAAYMAGQFYTIWLRIPALYPAYLGQRRAWMYWPVNCDEETRGTLTALNGRDEFSLMIRAPPGGGEVDREEVKCWIRKAIGADLEIEVLSCAPWMAGAALAVERYQVGRVFLAGDAAHLFTPVGAFGMNTGIDATHNLAWKLAAHHHSWAGPNLLTTYQTERAPIGFRNTRACRFYSTAWQPPCIPAELEASTPAGEAARKQVASSSYVRNHFTVPEDEDCTGVQLGARYDGSPLIVADADVEPPEDSWNIYVPSAVPGGRLPHLWLDATRVYGSSIFDRLGRWFTLLRMAGEGVARFVETEELERAAKARGVPLEVLDVDVPEARELYERRLLLVRPDRYVCWRGDEVPGDCWGLVGRVCGF